MFSALDGSSFRPPELVKISRTGTTSSSRCRADLRARSSRVGAHGSVDWWSCLALIRLRRFKEREVEAVSSVDLVNNDVSGFSALEGTVFRYERRCWPLAMRGDILLREEHGAIDASGSEEIKAEGGELGAYDELCVFHSSVRLWANLALSISSLMGRRWTLWLVCSLEISTHNLPLP